MESPFPDFVNKLPARNYGFDGLHVHSDISDTGETFFVYAEKEAPFPEHSHGAQFSVVISGECDFTADGKTVTCRKGATYRIPTGMKHQIALHPGYAEMDYVLNVDEEGKIPGKFTGM